MIRYLYPQTGRSFVIGITGSPGTGKSTLTYQLARMLRDTDQKVGIIAVDPTSPFSGGAVLGDRIRMQSLANDPGVFIRSMATRGQMGGISAATEDAVLALDSAGFEKILIETVGVGQDEVDIAGTAHVTVVILVPGLGDDIQSIKAGVMEIADVFVINKADLSGAAKTRREIESMLAINPLSSQREIPIIETVATQGEGIDQLVQTLKDSQNQISEGERLSDIEIQWARRRVMHLVEEKLMQTVLKKVPLNRLEGLLQQVSQRSIDPVTASEELLRQIL